ncbi:craniofacial development protein 2-like [Elysia marginata]|uniref:Craniofacial development protein 2-like n=1 Tax=Elysia marginata TaxID=1093978 RepID=A0AAV4HSV4_9GAST|nr:craniofacial development protein 2-like [Elysia marginata]
MIQFCEQHDMSVINTHFKQPKRRLYTWTSPGDVTRNQIDYLAKNSRFKNAVSKCKTYPGADIGSDHAPVIMKINIKLKIPRRKSTKAAKYDVSQLKNEELQKKYAVEVKNRFEFLM